MVEVLAGDVEQGERQTPSGRLLNQHVGVFGRTDQREVRAEQVEQGRPIRQTVVGQTIAYSGKRREVGAVRGLRRCMRAVPDSENEPVASEFDAFEILEIAAVQRTNMNAL